MQKKNHIALIEDNPGDARLIIEYLKECANPGYLVTTFDTLGGFLDGAERRSVDLVLLDLSLPDSSGIHTIDKVTTTFSKTPVVVLTGLDDDEIAIEAMRRGAQDYLVKSQINTVLLNRIIRYAIERRKTAEKLENSEKKHRKLELQIQHSQKMESIGNLAGGIAHDFNNILFPIIGMSEMLMEDLPPGSIEYENAREIYRAGQRAKELVSQILAFSRQSEHEMMPVRVQKVVKEVLKLCRATIPSNIDIQFHIRNECGSVWANATQLHQIVMNLLTNAYHAVEKKNGKIVVSLKEMSVTRGDESTQPLKPGRYVTLSVADNGIGMTDGVIEKMFDPYFTTKEKGKGTGLGLAVVYGIIHEYGGDIQVDSEVGKGSTIDIYLPVMEKETHTLPKNEDATIKTGHEHVLLVDDDKSVAMLEKQMIERLGYTVTVRLSSIDALETFRSDPGRFDIVVSDMAMPNMTGDQLALALRDVRPDIPVVICTGFSEKIDTENAAEMGVNGVLMKPVILSKMGMMIRAVLDKTR